jgi:hypothetical protein
MSSFELHHGIHILLLGRSATTHKTSIVSMQLVCNTNLTMYHGWWLAVWLDQPGEDFDFLPMSRIAVIEVLDLTH